MAKGSEETAAAPEPEQTNADAPPSENIQLAAEGHVRVNDIAGVRYRGIADRRVITVADLQRHGVDVEEDLEFNRSNNFTVDGKHVRSAAARDFFERDNDFEIIIG